MSSYRMAWVAAGHHVSIVQNGVVVALVQPPARPVSRSSLFGSQKGTIQMAEDFDETPAEFQEYVP